MLALLTVSTHFSEFGHKGNRISRTELTFHTGIEDAGYLTLGFSFDPMHARPATVENTVDHGTSPGVSIGKNAVRESALASKAAFALNV